jgi:hypothetical protein
VADRLESALDEAWRRDADQLVDRAIEAAAEGGKGALGWAEVLDSLVQHRVEHLVSPRVPPRSPRAYRLTSATRWASPRPACSLSVPSSRRSPPAPKSPPYPMMLNHCSRSAA